MGWYATDHGMSMQTMEVTCEQGMSELTHAVFWM